MLKRWQSLATFQTTNRDNSLYMLSSDYEYFRFIPVTAHFQKPARDQIERWTLAFNPCIPAGLHPHRTKVSGSLLKTRVSVINSCSSSQVSFPLRVFGLFQNTGCYEARLGDRFPISTTGFARNDYNLQPPLLLWRIQARRRITGLRIKWIKSLRKKLYERN